MTKVFIGIDNGKQGAITILNEDNEIEAKYIMPVNGKAYDIQALVTMLKNWDVQLVVLEKVFALPMIPRSSALSLGHCLGLMEGICATLGYPYVIVAPKTWQKEIFKGMDRKDTKAASIKFAKAMWPSENWLATERSRKPHDGLTDAACLALYGRLIYGK